MFNCDCSHWKLRTIIVIVCAVAFGITAYVALSIPFNTLSIYSYFAEIQFNEEMLSGSVNQFPVQNLTTLRLGNWAGSYADSTYSDMKMPAQNIISGYTIDIVKDHSTHTIQIIQNKSTVWLLLNGLVFVATIFTCCQAYLPRICLTYWIVEAAIVLTSGAALLANYFILSDVNTRMQKLGETIVTKTGPAFQAIFAADFVALLAIGLNRYLVKQIAKPAKAKANGGPKTTATTVQFNTTPVIDPALNVSQAAYNKAEDFFQRQQQQPRRQPRPQQPRPYLPPPPPYWRRRTPRQKSPTRRPMEGSRRSPNLVPLPPPPREPSPLRNPPPDDYHFVDRKTIAQETLEAIQKGYFDSKGSRTFIHQFVKYTVSGTVYFGPDDTRLLWRHREHPPLGKQSIVAIGTMETTTLAGAHTLFRTRRPTPKIGVLNFASAIEPGGGFRSGSSAQEQSIARSSTLSRSLESPDAYPFYQLHRSMAGTKNEYYYSHAMIYSPSVAIFRDDKGRWITPYQVDVVSSPAVNASEINGEDKEILRVMEERMGRILALFELYGIRDLVLGSFGTGVFRNDVKSLAKIWRQLLDGRFANSFDMVIFAIPDSDTVQKFESASRYSRVQ